MKSLTIVVYTCDTVDSCSSVRYRDVAYSHAVGVYCVIAPPAICLRVFNLLYLQDIESIISMCCADLPGLSFSGCNQEFYRELATYLSDQDKEKRERIINRILFGSDFSVNLLKVESYTEYISIFEHSPFTDEEIERIAEKNALSFLGLSE